MIDITMLGTAALFPLGDRALTSAYLRCGGLKILFDCGEGTQSAARKADVPATSCDIIALTHYHGDHIFGLPGLLQSMNSLKRTRPLTIVGPDGIEKELSPILTLAGDTQFELRLMTMPDGGMNLGDMDRSFPDGARLTAFPTRHRVPSQGYAFTLPRAGRFRPDLAMGLNVPMPLWSRLQKGETVQTENGPVLPRQVLGAPRRGLKVVFSGDTTACPALVEAAKGADLLISEATYGEDDQADIAREHGHMTFAQAAQVAREAEAKRLWLCHFSQMITDPGACLPNAQAHYPAAECAYDGKTVTLSFDETLPPMRRIG